MTISSAPFPGKIAESEIAGDSAAKVCRDISRCDFVFMMALDGFPPSLSCALEFQRMDQVLGAVDQQLAVVQQLHDDESGTVRMANFPAAELANQPAPRSPAGFSG